MDIIRNSKYSITTDIPEIEWTHQIMQPSQNNQIIEEESLTTYTQKTNDPEIFVNIFKKHYKPVPIINLPAISSRNS